jgi:adenosyl cobinamide kinase/adenosyl cobinamide phosphate guanylyltransferase
MVITNYMMPTTMLVAEVVAILVRTVMTEVEAIQEVLDGPEAQEVHEAQEALAVLEATAIVVANEVVRIAVATMMRKVVIVVV